MYLRQCFCKHQFEYAEAKATLNKGDDYSKEGIKVSITCKKCGFHKSYWKF